MKVALHCNNCGGVFVVDFAIGIVSYDGKVCSPSCWRELEEKKIASMYTREEKVE